MGEGVVVEQRRKSPRRAQSVRFFIKFGESHSKLSRGIDKKSFWVSWGGSRPRAWLEQNFHNNFFTC